MMHSDQVKAFELSLESSATRLRYGDTPFGRGCLAARRLVETGVPAVEVTLEGWDSHANNYAIHKSNGEILDQAFSALLSDLRKRDVWSSTLVVCLGEFGRTPRINPVQGRDHWPNGFSCLIGGAGLRGTGHRSHRSGKSEIRTARSCHGRRPLCHNSPATRSRLESRIDHAHWPPTQNQ